MTFGWTVAGDRTPSFGNASVGSKSWHQGSSITSFTVPAATGGDGTLSYTATGLAGGVSMSGSRVVSGTPSAAGTGTATVTATDSDGDTATLTFGWTVAGDRTPSFGNVSVGSKSWHQWSAITSFTVPAATGGDGTLVYTSTGLAAGVTMSGTRVVSGLPSAAGTGTATVTATDSDGDTATLTYDWTVSEDGVPSFGNASVGSKSWHRGSAITSFTVPAATGGDGTLVYTAMGLAAGVTMSGSRVVSGTPSAAGTGTATLTARDSDGDAASLTFNWTVAEDWVPSFGNASVGSRSWYQWSPITSFTVPAATGGNDTLVYTATGLPVGVVMSGTRVLSGTPSAAGTGTATVTATDSDGDTATLTFGWTVAANHVPDFGSVTVEAKRWVVDSAIESFTVPEATGGDGTLSYTATGLAAGVTMSGSRMVSGTPSVAGTGTATVTATDSDGDKATLTFKWTVTAAGARTLRRRVSEAILPSAALTILDDNTSAVEKRVAAMDEGSRDVASVSVTLGGQEVKPVAAQESSSESSGSATRDASGSVRFVLEDSSSPADPATAARHTAESSTMDARPFLGRSSFSVRAGGGGGWLRDPAFWGAGRYGNLSGGKDGLGWSGNLYGLRLGMDARPHEQWLAGLLAHRSRGTFDWNPTDSAGGLGGEYELALLGVAPYFGWMSRDRVWRLWGLVGYGAGRIRLTEGSADQDADESDLSMISAALGARRSLWRGRDVIASGTTTVLARGEVSTVRADLDGDAREGGLLDPLAVDAHRLRFGLEASHEHELPDGRRLIQSVKSGLRKDFGGGGNFSGVELGLGMGYLDPESSVLLESRGHLLAASGGAEEWSVELQLNYDPGVRRRGLLLDLTSGYGASGSGVSTGSRKAAGKLWDRDVAGLSSSGPFEPEAWLDAEAGYGFSIQGGRGSFTPYSGYSVTGDDDRSYRLGGRVEWDDGFSVHLEGERRETAGEAEHRVGLTGHMRLGDGPEPEGTGQRAPVQPAQPGTAANARPRAPAPAVAAAEAPEPAKSAVGNGRTAATPAADARAPIAAGGRSYRFDGRWGMDEWFSLDLQRQGRERAGKTAPPRVQPTAGGRRYRVQLGAFSTASRAAAAKVQAARRLEGFLKRNEQTVAVTGPEADGLWRIVLAEAFGRRVVADKVCATLTANGNGCYVVPPR